MGWKRIGAAISMGVGSVGFFGLVAPTAAAQDDRRWSPARRGQIGLGAMLGGLIAARDGFLGIDALVAPLAD